MTWRLLAGLILLALIAYAVANIVTGRRLEAELRKLKASGAPLTLVQAAPPRIPPDQNAALLYMKAFGMLPTGEDAEQIGYFVSLEESTRAKADLQTVEQVVARSTPIFSLLQEAASRPSCRFPVNWEAGTGAVFPHLTRIREVTRLIRAKALLEARNGHVSKAFNNIALIFRISDHIAAEPTLIAQLVRITCQAIALDTLNRVMEIAPPSTSEAHRMYEALRSIDELRPFTHGLEGERALGFSWFDLLRRNPRDFAAQLGVLREPLWARPLATPVLFLWRPFLKQDEVWYLRMMNKVVESSRRPRLRAEGPHHAIGEQLQREVPKYAILTRILVPVFSRATERRDKGIASIGLAEHGLALRAYQETTGRYPATLVELRHRVDWPLPRDPFTGKDFMYRREGNGYLLYSVGPNGKDEGGKDQRSVRGSLPGGQQPPDDIPWRMSR